MLVGGILTQYAGWRWGFFINVPIGLAIALAILKTIPEHEAEETNQDIDLPGALLITSSLMLQIYGFSQALVWGWLDAKTVSILAVAWLLLGAFIYNESRAPRPLMPLSIFRIRNLTGANMLIAPVYAGMMGMFFLTSLYIQGILHYSPAVTGLCFLPFPIIMGLVSTRIPGLVARFGFRPFMISGPLIIGLALLWLSRLQVDSSYWLAIFPTLVLMPIGTGLTIMPAMAAATSGVAPQQSGLASGLVSTSMQMGGALGLAILSNIAVSATRGAVGGTMSAATVYGYHMAFMVAAVFMAAGAGVAALVIRQPKDG
jgi:predicted MFS family arabinose efflux permease